MSDIYVNNNALRDASTSEGSKLKGLAHMNTLPLKSCRVCCNQFPATSEYFHRDKNKKDGLVTICKSCQKINRRNWYVDNKDHAIEYSKQWTADNYEHVLEQHREWGKLNPDKKKQYNDKWRLKHRDVYLASRRRRYTIHAEERRAESADWRMRNPEKVRIQFKVRQSRLRSAVGTHTPDDIRRIYAEQNGKCAYCGIDISLQIKGSVHVDHIHPISRGGSNWPENLACACAKCNLSKKDKTLNEWNGRD